MMPRAILFKGFDPGKEVIVTERRLPHWLQPGTTYFITFRLADSVPQHLLRQWREERSIWLEWHQPPWSAAVEREYEERFPKRMEEWMDAGMGACHLRNPEIRMIVDDHMRHFDHDRYDLDAYVLMTNHVHALITPKAGRDLFNLLQGLKGTSGKVCNARLGLSGQSFWMEDSYNRIVRDWPELCHFRDYITGNPDKSKLAKNDFTLARNDVLIPPL